jgi:hypothetical protein
VPECACHLPPLRLLQFSYSKGTPKLILHLLSSSPTPTRLCSSTYPSGANSLDYYQRSLDSTASLLVITSWKGPFPAGASIRAATQQVCGGLCAPYPFRVGKVVVVFTGDVTDPIHPFLGSVIEGASVKEAILQLDALAANSGT